jgi:hypothetical protein
MEYTALFPRRQNCRYYLFLILSHVVGKPEGKRKLGRYRPRWEDNIKMILEK